MNIKNKKALIAWAVSGPFGGHRLVSGKIKSGTGMLFLALLQIFIIRFTYAEPSKSPWIFHFWPPISALFNIKAVIAMIHPDPAFSDPEELMVRPVVWFLTLPSFIVTVWALFDGGKLIFEKGKGI